MKLNRFSVSVLLIGLVFVTQFYGCSSSNSTPSQAETQASTEAQSKVSDTSSENNDLEKNLDLSNAKTITLASAISAQDNCASVNGNVATISKAGTYVITGKTDNGQLVVDTKDEKDVYIVLDNADITYSNGSPIYIKNANNTYIVVLSGSENSVTDSENYTFESTDDTEPDAAIFSKNDLTIGGGGKLSVKGNYADAVKCKDDLTVCDGTLDLSAVTNGIKGRDSVTITGGNITINAGNDGIKTTNTENAEDGYISLTGGTINITCKGDGVQAQTDLTVDGASIDISSGGGAENAEQKSMWSSGDDSTVSAKGLKASKNIYIKQGNIVINSADDSIHCNSSAQISGAKLTLTAGDDGLHADDTLTISGGTINILQSYEGLEAQNINVSNGTVHLVSSDDGINAAGGNDGSNAGGPGGGDPFRSTGNGSLVISDGYIFVDSQGDGLDSNGSIEMTGGTVIVNGPTNSGNGAMDYDSQFNMTGGLLIAAGSSGMAQSVSDTSTLKAVSVTTNSQAANTLFSIQDADGNQIVTFSPSKQYSNVVVCSSKIESGSTYNVYIGGKSTGTQKYGLYSGGSYTGGTLEGSFTASSTVSYIGSSGNMGGGMGMGGYGRGGF